MPAQNNLIGAERGQQSGSEVRGERYRLAALHAVPVSEMPEAEDAVFLVRAAAEEEERVVDLGRRRGIVRWRSEKRGLGF